MFLTGSQISGLERVLMEHFAPKQKIDLVLSLSGELSDEAVKQMRNDLEISGLEFVKPLQMGYTDNSSYALYMSFRRPNRRAGYAALGIAPYIDDLLGELRVSILSWKII